MRSVEWIVGLVGGLCIMTALIGLAYYRSAVLGVELAAIPEPIIAAPTATIERVAAVTLIPTSTPLPSPTFLPTTTSEPTTALVYVTPVPVVHTVARGEDLYRIALQYGISLQLLATANGIGDTSRLIVGQRLVIPLAQQPVIVIGTQPTAAPNAPPQAINGVPIPAFIVISDQARQNMRQIFAHGLALGNNPRAFSSVGDSTIEYPYFMTRFDQPGGYNLGPYQYLQPAIDYYAGSFDRQSQGVMRGLRASTALNPFFSDKAFCLGNESRVACEYRLHRPSVVFIRLGSNDTQPNAFDQYLRQIVEFWINNGVVPIMGTKADRHEGPDNADNNIIRKIAADYSLPLWDFDLVAQTIPGSGVGRDGIHLTSFYSVDYTDPKALQTGYGVHNITALMALDAVWHCLDDQP